MLNRLALTHNPYQGKYKRVLSVCSAGLLRSPTVAWVLSSEPYNYNCRSCGIHDYALIPIDDFLIEWADEIIFVETNIYLEAIKKFNLAKKEVIVLNLPDVFEYRNPELIKIIREQYKDSFEGKKDDNLVHK